MKEIVEYQCEICHRRYSTVRGAEVRYKGGDWYKPDFCLIGSTGYQKKVDNPRDHERTVVFPGAQYEGDKLVGQYAEVFAKHLFSGEYWQQTGYHGFYDPADAMLFMTVAAQSNGPEMEFRVRRMQITVRRETICQMHGMLQ